MKKFFYKTLSVFMALFMSFSVSTGMYISNAFAEETEEVESCTTEYETFLEDDIPFQSEDINEESETEEDLSEKESYESYPELSVTGEESTVPEKNDAKQKYIQDFVMRLYTLVLNRQPDEEGFEYWISRLYEGESTGVAISYGFFFSQEFVNRKLSNDLYVETLYLTVLDRKADQEGKNSWVYKLNNGVSRKAVFKGFINSAEYAALCEKYGITAGKYIPGSAADQNDNVTMYVYRLYKNALMRTPESGGLNDWCEKINSGSVSIQKVTYGFIFSRELINKKYNNTQFVTLLYRSLFGREPDEGGLKNWKSKLDTGISRLFVFKGFIKSREYKNMVSGFGLTMKEDDLSEYNDYNGELSSITATAYIIYDEKAGTVVAGKNIDRVMYMASQTKLMTALVVLDHISNLNTRIRMTQIIKDSLHPELIVCGLVPGKYYTADMLLKGMLIYSGADCAELLAIYCCGNANEFAKEMNKKAAELGMAHTTFVDPTGLGRNSSTLREYMKLAAAARKNTTIANIIKTPGFVLTDVTGEHRQYFANSNGLVSGYTSYDKNLYTVDGMKTGMTDMAGYCLTTSSCNASGARVITAVWNCAGYNMRTIDSRILLDVVYKNAKKGYYCLK